WPRVIAQGHAFDYAAASANSYRRPPTHLELTRPHVARAGIPTGHKIRTASTALGGSLAGIRNDAQARRPDAVRPALALADLGAQPGFVLINAFLRAKAFERSTVPHQAEFAVAVRAVVLHGFLPEWQLYRPVEDQNSIVHCNRPLLQCTISITALY